MAHNDCVLSYAELCLDLIQRTLQYETDCMYLLLEFAELLDLKNIRAAALSLGFFTSSTVFTVIYRYGKW